MGQEPSRQYLQVVVWRAVDRAVVVSNSPCLDLSLDHIAAVAGDVRASALQCRYL